MKSMTFQSLRLGQFGKPTAGRFSVLASLIWLLLGAGAGEARAQNADGDELRITEKQAVQRALEHTDRTRAWSASVTEARAEAIREGAWPNPTVSYTHEQSYEEPDAVGEDFVVLEQALPLSGRRGLRADAARASADARRHEVTARMAKTAADVRTAYYDVLYLRERIALRVQLLEDMRQLEALVVRRVEAGESAAYDLERLRKEIADAEADVGVDRATLDRERARLRGVLYLSDKDGDIVPTGSLMPGELPSDEALLGAVSQRPEVAAATSRVEAAEYAERAASRWWVPEPTLSAGYRGASVAGDHFPGFLAGVSLTLPLFDQSGGERLAARAQMERAKSRRRLLQRKYEAQVTGLADQVRRLEAAATTYRKEGLERSERVVEVARSAYDAGELGILDLVDAHRGLFDARLRALELARSARTHEIELRRNLGQPTVDVKRPKEQ
jgi:cobalt-zinc-cadmium efflux system outer membrane protein